jgi:hypothetical protein
LAFVMIVFGLTYERFAPACLICGFRVPGHATYYRHQHEIEGILNSCGVSSCRKWAAELPPGTKIACDGSWSHRR